jgi:hypothetical protein|nr:MAG TPA: hypothetical protein [Caudoviricetes sp.]
MATTDLGKWMITNGGEYNPDTTYEQLTMVLYQNSTYITLRTVTGIIPNNDKINYILMAQGFSANALADVVAKDTYGVIGDVSGDVSAQNLVDYLTNEVVNNLLKKTSISTVQTNSDNTVPSSSLAYVMQQEITKNKEDIATANSNLSNKNIIGTYNIPNITGVSTAPENIAGGYHNVAKYSNGQCMYSALVYVYTSAISNSVIGTISSQYAPKQDISAYVYDFAGKRFLMILISSNGTIKLLTLEGTSIPESAVKVRGSIVF